MSAFLKQIYLLIHRHPVCPFSVVSRIAARVILFQGWLLSAWIAPISSGLSRFYGLDGGVIHQNESEDSLRINCVCASSVFSGLKVLKKFFFVHFSPTRKQVKQNEAAYAPRILPPPPPSSAPHQHIPSTGLRGIHYFKVTRMGPKIP